ncbi:hypothetical protein DMB66_59515 [Actinoplanes sp. ATCC 53533]|nr:hypothetical protein DMB66_59515 [Actinoplanes sp. ATCC 53533]
MSFHAAEEVFNVLISDEEGLGALDVTDTAAGRGLARYHLAVAQNLRMFFRQAKNAVQPSDRDAYVWDRAKALARANQGQFDQVIPVAMPEIAGASLSQTFGDVDQNGKTRLVVLDPRQWTLHNGRDTLTRSDVAALLGVGEQALPVDNGASCVVACVNTQRRDNVRKRATELLAWRSVLGQLDPDDDKRRDALGELRTATERVDADLLKAFQHLAYLTRTDRVEADWQRFDDDTKSSLKGSHVWDALVKNGRAVYPGKLSGDYLRTLLSKMPRALTLKEIGQQFYKNAAFPMVPSSDDIRRAVFQTLSGPDAYEVVDGNGEALTISSVDELSIGSMDLSLRKATGTPPAGTPTAGAPGTDTTPGTGTGTESTGSHQPKQGPVAGEREPEYRRYQLEVPNRSLVDPDTRRALANLLQSVLDAVDPDTGGDLQLLDLQLNLTADSAAVEEIEQRASAVGASWTPEELDF